MILGKMWAKNCNMSYLNTKKEVSIKLMEVIDFFMSISILKKIRIMSMTEISPNPVGPSVIASVTTSYFLSYLLLTSFHLFGLLL